MMGMKKMTELIRFVSMPVFSVIFVAVLVLDAALFQSMSTNMETNIRETGEARLAWIKQSLERYVTITTVMEGRVKESGGRTVPDQTKLADFVKMDNALRSIQIVQEDGTFTGYNQDADIRNFTNPETGSLKKLALEARRSGNVSITPAVEVGEGLRDIVVVRPVFLSDGKGDPHFWGYILAIIDTRIFLGDANVSNLKDQDILCGLFHTEGDGTVSSLYENGDYRKEALTVSREIYADQWTMYLRPEGPWVNPWIIVLTTWAGILTALALAVLARRNARLRRLGTTDALTGVYNRNGGDEFIIFYGDSLTGEAARAIDRFTGEPHEITYKGKKIQFYSSLGFALYPNQDRNYRGLCIKADYALYGAKLNGKARWKEFDPELTPEDTRTQLGFNLTDIGNEMPGAMAVYRAEDKHILYASSPLVELMECENLDDFMKYTAMALDRIFPDSLKRKAEEEIGRQMKDPANRRRRYFIETEILTKKGNLRPVEIRGHLNRNTNYGDVFYVFLYEKEQKEP